MKLSSDISAVVTGGASGLGEATARLLASKGVRVGIFDYNKERGAEVAKDIGGVFALMRALKRYAKPMGKSGF